MSAAQPSTAPANASDNVGGTEFRRRLLDGMATAIRQRGFRDCTIADIVGNARTSRRTFYEHFASKQDCYLALIGDVNQRMVASIATAVDGHAPWDVQVRQAIEAWIAATQEQPAIMLSWIRDTPLLGDQARQTQRDTLEPFVTLVQTLAGTPDLRAAGITPPSRQLAIILLGGLRELVATTVEDGDDITGIIEVAVDAAKALLGPQRLTQP